VSGYDFTGLSPTDFEEHCNDLLSKELSVCFESFTEGKDGEIDPRHQKLITPTFFEFK